MHFEVFYCLKWKFPVRQLRSTVGNLVMEHSHGRRTHAWSKPADNCAGDKVSDMVVSPSAAGESHHKLKQVFPVLKCQETKDILEWKTWSHNISFFNSQLDGRTMTSLRPLRRARDASIHGTWTMLPIVVSSHSWTRGLSLLASAGPCIAYSSSTWDCPSVTQSALQELRGSRSWQFKPATSETHLSLPLEHPHRQWSCHLLLSYVTAVCQPETLESVPSCSWKHRHSSPKSASPDWSESFELFLEVSKALSIG